MKKLFTAAAAVSIAAALSACGDPAKAPAREEAAADRAEFASLPRSDRSGRSDDRRSEDRADPRDEPTPMHEGRPLWSATSRYTSEENAERAFRSHGRDFAATGVDDYVDAAHAFLKNPPSDVLTLERANGDTLYYAPGDNVFAVAREDGAPRTLFKPDEGMAYWREQEQREEARADRG